MTALEANVTSFYHTEIPYQGYFQLKMKHQTHIAYENQIFKCPALI